MMKAKIFSTLILICLLGFTSCQKWLEVQPEDKFTEDQIYDTPAAIAEAMNGIYIKLGTNNLYGENLTLKTLDLFAQLYYGGTIAEYRYLNFGKLAYGEDGVKANIKTTWTDMYVTIGNINHFLKNIELYKAVLTEAQYRQYKGEALALRAFLHFDLYRMFAPAYQESLPTQETIPYYRDLSLNIESFRSQEELIADFEQDIADAEHLLLNDPILTQSGTTNQNNFRFNYYALIALKARLYYYIGDNEKAYQAAKVIIDQDAKFPWVTHALATGTEGYVDRIFYSENIFDTYNSKLYERYTDLFSSSNTVYTVLSTGPEDYVNTVYEGNQADYRFTYGWGNSNTGGVPHKISVKYSAIIEPLNVKVYSKYAVPIIKKSEMYYIASQTSSDQNEALSLLNTVRRHRNLAADVENWSAYNTELTKEYMKEFFGEGQLFYYYKRNGMTSIATPNSSSRQLMMSATDYILPIPEDEYTGR